jgi:hypothetical protein
MGARKLATLVIDSEHYLTLHHTKGKMNLVADLLSWSAPSAESHTHWYNDPSDDELTHRFHSHLPQLIPRAFKISPLPSNVLYWIMLALRTVESSWTRNRKRATRQETEFGSTGKPTSSSPRSPITPSSLLYRMMPSTSSFVPSLASTAQLSGVSQAEWMDDIRNHWSQTPSGLPQAVWLRCFGTVSD